MASEKAVNELMDILVSPRAPAMEGPESLGARSHAMRLRRAIHQPNVVGIGVAFKRTERTTLDELGLTVYVVKKLALSRLRADEAVPPMVASPSGRPVLMDIVEIGTVKPEANVKRGSIQPGYSVGHFGGDTGTLGAIVMRDGKYFVLSNSHVLARCGKAKRGDAVLYPGVEDGGKKARDQVGALADFVALKARGTNTADTAIAEIDPARISQVVAKLGGGIGVVRGTAKAKVGMKVEKVGRTTGKTTGVVVSNRFRPLRMPYPEVGDISFEDQLLISRFTKPGDSGSLVVSSESKKAVGLHFAGAKGGSVAAPIERVLELMGVELVVHDL